MHPLAVTLLVISINHLLSDNINSKGCGINSVLEEQANSTKFIVGGQVTPGPGSWPWVCSVGFLNTDVWEHQCGGTLVTHIHVLTAAHCPETFKDQGRDDRIMVRCGDFHLMESTDDGGVQVRGVSRYHTHDRYKFPKYDISVLVMKTQFLSSPFIRPICLENSRQVDSTDGVLVLGWGIDRYGEHGMELNIANLQIQMQNYCKEVVENVTGFGDDLLCAVDQALGGSGSCFGDSGGPVIALNFIQHRYELKGLVSGGAVPGQCGAFGAPDIFTRTSFDNIYRWIRKKTEENILVKKKRPAPVILLGIPLVPQAGSNFDGRRCCTPENPCGEGEGDCDGADDGGLNDGDRGCRGELVCGSNNCKQFGAYYHDKDDCCEKPPIIFSDTPTPRQQQQGWGAWTQWSPCTVACGPGYSHRTRKCVGSKCGQAGFHTQDRQEKICIVSECNNVEN